MRAFGASEVDVGDKKSVVGPMLTHVPFVEHFGGPDSHPCEEKHYEEREVVDVVRLERHADLEDVAVFVHELAEVNAEVADHGRVPKHVVHHQIGRTQTAGEPITVTEGEIREAHVAEVVVVGDPSHLMGTLSTIANFWKVGYRFFKSSPYYVSYYTCRPSSSPHCQ